MVPRSPTYELATPALEHHPQNFSPLNHLSHQNANDMQSRAVHFSESPVMPPVARHSIATSHVPLLQSVASASQLPHSVARTTYPTPNIDLNAAIEYHKNTADHLRKIHDNDRKAWDIEKSALLARIADLEFKLNKARDPKRRSSNDSSIAVAPVFRSDFGSTYASYNGNGLRKGSESVLPGHPPVWHGPESTPPVTRVFSHDDDVPHLPSISEDEPMSSLSKQISPTHREDAHPIHMGDIDRELDGITVKSTGPAVTSSFIKVSSPPLLSPGHTPSPVPKDQPNGALRVGMDRLLSPMDEKLKRHAGHTPMAFDGTLSTGATTDTAPSPGQEQPPEPAPTTRPPLQPSENSESYFSFTEDSAAKPQLQHETIPEEAIDDEPQCEPEDDPALKGPLMLDPSAKSQAANDFLDQVDAKLMQAAVRNDSESAEDGTDDFHHEESHKKHKEDDSFPQLKIRKSTNFGSAWGGELPGRI